MEVDKQVRGNNGNVACTAVIYHSLARPSVVDDVITSQFCPSSQYLLLHNVPSGIDVS